MRYAICLTVLLACSHLSAEGPAVMEIMSGRVSGPLELTRKYAWLGEALATAVVSDLSELGTPCQGDAASRIAATSSAATQPAAATHRLCAEIILAQKTFTVTASLEGVSDRKELEKFTLQLPYEAMFEASAQLASRTHVAVGNGRAKPLPSVGRSLRQVEDYLSATALIRNGKFDEARTALAKSLKAGGNRFVQGAHAAVLYNNAIDCIRGNRLMEARVALSDLLANQPGGPLAVEGRKLLAELNERLPLRMSLKEVSGEITQDTVWPKAKSPIRITGNVKIVKGVTVVVEPGTEVQVDQDKAILVEGKFIARGRPREQIVFAPAKGVMSWQGLKVDGGSVANNAMLQAEDCSITGAALAVEVTGAAWVFIRECSIRGSCSPINWKPRDVESQTNGIRTSGFAVAGVIEDTDIAYCDKGLHLSSGKSIVTRRLSFVQCAYAAGSQSDGYLTDCLLAYCRVGVGVDLTSKMKVARCAFIGIGQGWPVLPEGYDPGLAHALYPLAVYGSEDIFECLFQDCLMAIRVSARGTPTISRCNFLNVQAHSIEASEGKGTISAPDNWWGTVDANAISKAIRDFNDAPSLPTVEFTPIAVRANVLDLSDVRGWAELQKTLPKRR